MVSHSLQKYPAEDGAQKECSNSDTSSDVMGNSGKQRLRWTQELRDCFEEAVNQLGGADRATPKGILKIMGLPGLTIYHVKSHLQKFRMAKFIPESFDRKHERRKVSDILPNFGARSGVQIAEVLKMQLDAYRQLNKQFERHLKLTIRAQGKYLDKMAGETQNFGATVKPRKPPSPLSLPPLSDESGSNAKDYESDSGVNLIEGMNGIGGFKLPEKPCVELPMHGLRRAKMADINFEDSHAKKRQRVADEIFPPGFEEDQPKNPEASLHKPVDRIFLPNERQFQGPNHDSLFLWPGAGSRESTALSSFCQ